jgi:hypothetical protein
MIRQGVALVFIYLKNGGTPGRKRWPPVFIINDKGFARRMIVQPLGQLVIFTRFQPEQRHKPVAVPEIAAKPFRNQLFQGKRIKWLILPLHESETDRHLIGLSG